MSQQGELVSDALDCWVAARLIEAQFRVFNGGAMIGMEHVDEAGHPFDGFTPVTPIMDSQLDDMVIRNLIRPFCERFLRRLKDKIDQRKRENWLEIYLSLFIMMSNMGLVMKDMATQARWKGLKVSTYPYFVLRPPVFPGLGSSARLFEAKLTISSGIAEERSHRVSCMHVRLCWPISISPVQDQSRSRSPWMNHKKGLQEIITG